MGMEAEPWLFKLVEPRLIPVNLCLLSRIGRTTRSTWIPAGFAGGSFLRVLITLPDLKGSLARGQVDFLSDLSRSDARDWIDRYLWGSARKRRGRSLREKKVVEHAR